MQAKDIKMSETYYLKKDYSLVRSEGINFLFRAGTPIHLVSKPKHAERGDRPYRFTFVGSFAGLDINENLVDDNIADFMEEANRTSNSVPTRPGRDFS